LGRAAQKTSPYAGLGVEHERMFYVYLLHSAKDNGFYRVKGFASRGLVGLF